MEKIILIFSILLALSFTEAFGQKDSLSPKTFFALKTDLAFLTPYAFPIIYSHGYVGALSVEQGFSYRHSFQLTGQVFHYGQPDVTLSWKIIPEYKFFLKKQHFKGFYTGVYLKYVNQVYSFSYLRIGDNLIKDKYLTYGAGATFGFQTYIKKHLTLDILLGIGGRYLTRSTELPPGSGGLGGDEKRYPVIGVIWKYPYIGVDGRFSINLGYKF